MELHELSEVLGRLAASGRLYEEFVRSHDLSVGLYRLPAGTTDPQSPHTEDEVYYILSGQARIHVGDDSRTVGAGSIVFVAADVEHRFFDITEDLAVLVVFGPAEYTHRVDHERGHPHGVTSVG
jgi:mannose-6-phosphate isomerase-like protein (cupin superfamily)